MRLFWVAEVGRALMLWVLSWFIRNYDLICASFDAYIDYTSLEQRYSDTFARIPNTRYPISILPYPARTILRPSRLSHAAFHFVSPFLLDVALHTFL